MKVSELMTTDVRACRANEMLDRAARLMWDGDCGCIPVVDHNSALVGMITDRDICMAAYTQGRLLEEIPVSRAMSVQVQSCKPEDDIDRVEKAMRARKVRRLPVVDHQGHLRGVLSLADIAQRAARDAKIRTGSKKVSFAEVGETLAAVSAPRQQELVAAAS